VKTLHPSVAWSQRFHIWSESSAKFDSANSTIPYGLNQKRVVEEHQAASPALSEETMAIRNLSNLRAPKRANENKKRVGRGMGSGMGKTSTRGHKGQGSRSGSSLMRGFEGGQMPLHRRLPKRGFTNIFRVEYQVLGLDRVAEIVAAENVTEFTLDKIIELGLLRKKGALIKVLNNGEIKTAVTVHAHKFSKTAQEAIEKAGGKAILIG
jgi:large subunit ribosomal protein L15